MKYRTEWKYICTDHDLDILKGRMQGVLAYDEHSGDKPYHIRSLYFDDYLNNCAFDNDAGSSERFKWRIRYYNDDPDLMKLERKEKNDDLCYKESCRISRKEYDEIINGSIYQLLNETDDKLLKEFCVDIITRKFTPKIIIDYERTAFVEPISNIRITFDRNIAASLKTDEFLAGTYPKYPLQEKGNQILEVKFDDALPSFLEKIVHSGSFQRNTFSKYYLGRIVLERNLI